MSKIIKLILSGILIVSVISLGSPRVVQKDVIPTATVKLKATSTVSTSTYTPTTTEVTVTITDTPTETLTPTETSTSTLTLTPSDTPTPSSYTDPYPSAPLCPDSGDAHENTKFHTLWDGVRGCHYDHEHGTLPFTQEVSTTFPGFDLFSLLGDVEVGHTNPSSPMENTHKHGGFKWNVHLEHPQECAGFEGAVTGVNGSVIQYHGFGDYEIEAEARLHSTVALLRQCRTSNPTDYGYVFINQLQDYGQRITPYQGIILPYPNQPVPAYLSPRGPYLSFNCIDLTSPYDSHCRAGLQQAQTSNNQTTWTSKPTGVGHSDTPSLFQILWRGRDVYNILRNDNYPNLPAYPFEFLWLCTSDGGLTYNPTGCRYNNTTTRVHEIQGIIPSAWDNLSGWDSNPVVGRITAEGYVDGDGVINTACSEPREDCFPVKLVNAFTGSYGSALHSSKIVNNISPGLPERDIYFCNGTPCSETSPGAIPSGWVGEGN